MSNNTNDSDSKLINLAGALLGIVAGLITAIVMAGVLVALPAILMLG